MLYRSLTSSCLPLKKGVSNVLKSKLSNSSNLKKPQSFLLSTQIPSVNTPKRVDSYFNYSTNIPKVSVSSHQHNNYTKGNDFPFWLVTSSLVGLGLCISECSEQKNSNCSIDLYECNLFTNNGKNVQAVRLIEKFNAIPIPKEKENDVVNKFNQFLTHVNAQPKTDAEKLAAVKLYIKGYTQFFLHYEKFPNKLKKLYSDPKILDKCNYQLYHIAGIPFSGGDTEKGVLFRKTEPTPETLGIYCLYKNSVKQLGDSGIMSLGEGRGSIHVPWSLSASKIVMRVLENAYLESLDSIITTPAELEEDYLTYVDGLSNAILKLVFWAVTVDDIPDSMSKEMPKETNQLFLDAMKLISDVEFRKREKINFAEDIFTVHPGELEAIKKKLNPIANEAHRVACEQYVESAYTAFHSAWDSFQDLATISDVSKSQIRRDFSEIMNSFQHALDVNYDPKPFNIQKAEDVHYGMHIVVFSEMALTLADALKHKHTGVSYVDSKSDDYIQLFRRQSLLMQQMGSIANLICTGVSDEGSVSRELMDGDFSNQLLFNSLFTLKKNSDFVDINKHNRIEDLLKSLMALKNMKRDWFLKYGTKQDTLSKDAICEKDSLEKNWNSTVTTLAGTLTDPLPDLFDKWITLYTHSVYYDENEFMSEDAIVFLFQNIVVKGKL